MNRNMHKIRNVRQLKMHRLGEEKNKQKKQQP